MYDAVPKTSPGAVAGEDADFAIPKSATFTLPVFVTRMFWGFISLCITPFL
jgi:hypothetical protein